MSIRNLECGRTDRFYRGEADGQEYIGLRVWPRDTPCFTLAYELAQ